jgi:hypothetical protein
VIRTRRSTSYLGVLAVVASSALTAQSPGTHSTWWSLRPLQRPAVPAERDAIGRPLAPIDAFVAAALRVRGLVASPEADRRTLIRRLAFDLLGLPPSPAEVDAFVADPDPQAYPKLVDRLLASPRYGERWARHWLDVVHYADTHGYDKDKLRPHAWPYRDYVIRALNADQPYARFVQEQLAGDVLFPGTRDGIEALGFIAAGPWDFIGHEEVPESKVDGKIARHLDRDDMVANTMLTFASTTVHCAQCHDHKFDPIPQSEYYGLQAVFAALDRTEVLYDTDDAVAARRRQLAQTQSELRARRTTLVDALRARVDVRALDAAIELAERAPGRSAHFGYHSAIASDPATAKWVQVDLGRSEPLARVTLHPCRDDFNGIGAGFGFPPRFKVELSDDPQFARGVTTLADATASDIANPGLAPQILFARGLSARYVRVTATRLAPRQNDWIFALAELGAIAVDGRNVALGATVTALDSIEAPVRWQRSNLTDGYAPGAKANDDTATLRRERETALVAAASEAEQRAWRTIDAELAEATRQASALPPQARVYAGAVHHGSGTFVGTGAQGGAPRPIHVLARGNVQKPGALAAPGALSAAALPARFALPTEHREGDRRAALAHWLTAPENPLTWRSIVNRVWLHHFGRGLVDTPNDFGRMGAQPTHPELLDWLAVEFRDGGQSLKGLHRLIVTSATYRQVASATPATQRALQSDADNRFLWRQHRRKLEAEAVRDTILALAGKLDLTMGGPGFADFAIEKPEHSPHYEYHRHDPDDPAAHRRSIYRIVVRSQPQPFLTALDCADPAMQVARRNESVSPLQALALLDNPLVLAMAEHFATRTARGGGDLSAQVQRAHREALGRAADAAELAALVGYARAFGMANLCRVLFNRNEFHFVD